MGEDGTVAVNLAVKVLLDLLTICINFVVGYKVFIDVMELKNVYELIQERLKVIFKEFDNIYISFSGGKDSGVLLNLCLDYMRRNRLFLLGIQLPGKFHAVTLGIAVGKKDIL